MIGTEDELGSEYIQKYLTLRTHKKIGVIHRTGRVVTFSQQYVLFPNEQDAEQVPLQEMKNMIDFWFPMGVQQDAFKTTERKIPEKIGPARISSQWNRRYYS